LFRIEDARKCPHLFKAKYKVKESKKNLCLEKIREKGHWILPTDRKEKKQI
jgi:hypothetical protein